MAEHRRWAPGGKLDAEDVAAVRRLGVDAAQELGVPASRRHLLRIAKGQSWRDGWAPPRAADGAEAKPCVVCGTWFSRRFASGRMRCARLWAQKTTCGYGCNLRRLWQQGAFEGRRVTYGRKKSLPCSLSTH